MKDFNIGQRGEGAVKDWNFSAHIYIKENFIFQVEKGKKDKLLLQPYILREYFSC